MAAPPPVVDLRPLSTGELIDRGFTLYRNHFAGLFLLALLSQGGPLMAQVTSNVLHLSPARDEILLQGPAEVFSKLGLLYLLLIVAHVIQFGFSVVMTYYVSDIYLGRVASIGASFRRLAECLAGTVWTSLLTLAFYLLAMIFPICAGVVLAVWIRLSPPQSFPSFVAYSATATVLALASFLPVLVVAMRLMVTVPVLALEGLAGWRGCRRSSALVRFDPGLGFFYWGETRLSLLLLPLFVISIMCSSLTSLPQIIAGVNEFIHQGTTTTVTNPSDIVLVGSQVLTYLAGALILPLYSIAVLLFYYDVRIRSEGFDLEIMVDRLEGAS